MTQYLNTERVAISIHAPRTGSDALAMWCVLNHGKFQSTLPARGATHRRHPLLLLAGDFNPRSPHGERPIPLVTPSFLSKISIHAPRTGSDIRKNRNGATGVVFQSTLPARGATWMQTLKKSSRHDFNPRSPHGERLVIPRSHGCGSCISIHAPRTGSDHPPRPEEPGGVKISIHAPRTGSDRVGKAYVMNATLFQSTLPARGATIWWSELRKGKGNISIHAPRTGSDSTPCV